MAINGIHSARDARMVAGELKRLVVNLGTGLLLFGLSGQDVSIAKEMLSALQSYSNELLKACSGKQENDEVFLPEALIKDAEAQVGKILGGFGL